MVREVEFVHAAAPIVLRPTLDDVAMVIDAGIRENAVSPGAPTSPESAYVIGADLIIDGGMRTLS